MDPSQAVVTNSYSKANNFLQAKSILYQDALSNFAVQHIYIYICIYIIVTPHDNNIEGQKTFARQAATD